MGFECHDRSESNPIYQSRQIHQKSKLVRNGVLGERGAAMALSLHGLVTAGACGIEEAGPVAPAHGAGPGPSPGPAYDWIDSYSAQGGTIARAI